MQVELTKRAIEYIRRDIAKQNSVFSDKRYLDSLFLPSNIIGRRKQAEQLLRHVESLKQGFVVPQISVYGRSGSGKSTVVKFVCQNIQDIVSFAFVNLRKSKTIFGCANLILSSLGLSNLKSAEGLNKAIDKIAERIEETLVSDNKKFFLLVLDEYDVIFSDHRNRPSDFIYKLLTLEENLREKGLWLCIVTISNNALSDYDLDDRVKSRMGSSDVFFPPYTEGDVIQILQDRASRAFAKKVEDDVLQYCANLSSDNHGDARRALDLLRLAGELCDGKKVTKSDIDKAQEQLQKDRISTIVSNASYHQRIVIGAICANTLLNSSGSNTTSTIYERYRKMVLADKKPLSYRRVADLLIELENTGFVTSRTISKGRQGYGSEYRLKLSPELVGSVLDKEWWDSLVIKKVTSDVIERHKKEWKKSPFGRRWGSSWR